MEMHQRVLFVDPSTDCHKTRNYGFARYFGPVDLGIHLVGKAPVLSVLYLNGCHGEEIEVEVIPLPPEPVWESGPQGVYALTREMYRRSSSSCGLSLEVNLSWAATASGVKAGCSALPFSVR